MQNVVCDLLQRNSLESNNNDCQKKKKKNSPISSDVYSERMWEKNESQAVLPGWKMRKEQSSDGGVSTKPVVNQRQPSTMLVPVWGPTASTTCLRAFLSCHQAPGLGHLKRRLLDDRRLHNTTTLHLLVDDISLMVFSVCVFLRSQVPELLCHQVQSNRRDPGPVGGPALP